MNKTVLVAGAFALAIGLSYWQTYNVGVNAGAKEVQGRWDVESKKQSDALAAYQKANAKLIGAHETRHKLLEESLEEQDRRYTAHLLLLESDYASRLQLSETRASVYSRQARGSATEQERLARHAAELDRSLEEGRALVRELGATLRQREVTIRALGGIILNDRTLLESE